VTAAAGAAIVSVSGASAQTYGQQDALDPYAQPPASYTYAVPAPQGGRAYPYVGGGQPVPYYYAYPRAPRSTAKIVHRPAHEVVDERLLPRKHKQVATTVVDDAPVKPQRSEKSAPLVKEPTTRVDVTGTTGGKGRVIRAEAEVTILGPDRMSIRLIRRRGAPAADSSAQSED
jgi:hypothetical protein